MTKKCDSIFYKFQKESLTKIANLKKKKRSNEILAEIKKLETELKIQQRDRDYQKAINKFNERIKYLKDIIKIQIKNKSKKYKNTKHVRIKKGKHHDTYRYKTIMKRRDGWREDVRRVKEVYNNNMAKVLKEKEACTKKYEASL